MANYTITLTAGEDNILQAVATLKGVSADAIVTSVAKGELTSQVLQYLEEEGKNKVSTMSAAEKVAFLNT